MTLFKIIFNLVFTFNIADVYNSKESNCVTRFVWKSSFFCFHPLLLYPSTPILLQYVSFPYLHRQLSLIILNDLRGMVFTSLFLNNMLIFLSLSLFFLLSFRNHDLILTTENKNLVFHTHFPSRSIFIHIAHLSLFI